MSWGKKPDLKDQMIHYLQEQIATKDLQIADLHNQILALSRPGAYRMLHPQQEKQEAVTLMEQPILSPSRIPAYRIIDEKMWEGVEKRYRDNEQAIEHDKGNES